MICGQQLSQCRIKTGNRTPPAVEADITAVKFRETYCLHVAVHPSGNRGEICSSCIMADEKNASSAAEFTPPDWLNVDLIQKALKNSGEQNLQVKNLSVKIATAPGDNYASTIYRVKVTLSDGSERPLLVKGPVPGATMAKMTSEFGAFQREAFMLTEVVPQIQAILDEAAPGKFPPFAARCPHHSFDPVELLVLEDLAPGGFKMADRKRGVDFRHALIAVRALARFHAASHALLRRQPELAEKLPNPWANRNKSTDAIVQMFVQAAADACRSWPGFEEYAPLLEKFKIGAADVPVKLGEVKPYVLDVIAHGDFWVNNMLFRYQDGDTRPKGHRMVDFQISVALTPVYDLHYFFATSLDENVSTHHEDTLVREYHSALSETLALLKLKAPSLEALQADMKLRGAYALTHTLNIIPIVRAQNPAVDFEAVFAGDNSSFVALYEDPVIKKWMQRVIPEFKRRGWLPS